MVRIPLYASWPTIRLRRSALKHLFSTGVRRLRWAESSALNAPLSVYSARLRSLQSMCAKFRKTTSRWGLTTRHWHRKQKSWISASKTLSQRGIEHYKNSKRSKGRASVRTRLLTKNVMRSRHDKSKSFPSRSKTWRLSGTVCTPTKESCQITSGKTKLLKFCRAIHDRRDLKCNQLTWSRWKLRIICRSTMWCRTQSSRAKATKILR